LPLFEFRPTNYLPANRKVPALYPDTIMQLIVTALQAIKTGTTLGDIDQTSFTGTYIGFYYNIMKHGSKGQISTCFVDEMCGVTVAARVEKKSGSNVIS
jgi:hypothetical protein